MLALFILAFFLPVFIVFFLYSILGDTEFRDDGNIFAAFFFSGIASFILSGIVFTFFASYKTDNLPTEERAYASYHLVALDANEDLNGSFQQTFFIGSGYIGEDLYYHFYYDTKNGIKYVKRRAESIYIIETDDQPKYVKYGSYISDTSSIFYKPGRRYETRDVLYIPSGTIKKNYKVN